MGAAPYLLIKSSVAFKEGVCFAVVDAFHIQTNTSLEAFKIVYEAHHVLNLKYDSTLSVFFNFFDILLKIKNINALITVRKLLESNQFS